MRRATPGKIEKVIVEKKDREGYYYNYSYLRGFVSCVYIWQIE